MLYSLYMIYIYINTKLHVIRILLFIILSIYLYIILYKLYNVGWFLGTPKPPRKPSKGQWPTDATSCPFAVSWLPKRTTRLEAASNQSAQSPKRPWTMSKSKRSLFFSFKSRRWFHMFSHFYYGSLKPWLNN